MSANPTEGEMEAAVNPSTGQVDPRFCITCRELCDWRKDDWFWNGDNHGQEHWRCREERLAAEKARGHVG